MRSAEGIDKLAAVLLLAQGQGGEGQPGGPALGVLDQFFQVGVGQRRLLRLLA